MHADLISRELACNIISWYQAFVETGIFQIVFSAESGMEDISVTDYTVTIRRGFMSCRVSYQGSEPGTEFECDQKDGLNWLPEQSYISKVSTKMYNFKTQQLYRSEEIYPNTSLEALTKLFDIMKPGCYFEIEHMGKVIELYAYGNKILHTGMETGSIFHTIMGLYSVAQEFPGYKLIRINGTCPFAELSAQLKYEKGAAIRANCKYGCKKVGA